ncbi:MAG: hypothetical protein E6772_07275 [Dysgonomonas sp.]|nr:hypothetical protein [Dysgonomonas sp.]
MNDNEYLRKYYIEKIMKDLSLFFDEVPIEQLTDYLTNLMVNDVNMNRDDSSTVYGLKLINFLCRLDKDMNNSIVKNKPRRI